MPPADQPSPADSGALRDLLEQCIVALEGGEEADVETLIDRHPEHASALRHQLARLDGMGEFAIIFRHLVPSVISHIIATLTLAIPTMILAETALSFLGIGLQPPVISWGVLLQEARNIRAVSQAPWLLFAPAGAIVISVLSFNFLGDGLRDAADPYGSTS